MTCRRSRGRVEAVGPLASGTWTTPDGRLLVEDIGEIARFTCLAAVESARLRVPLGGRNAVLTSGLRSCSSVAQW